MKVRLITHTPEPEKLVACAAKLCYANSGINDLYDGLTDEKVAAFIDKLAALGHESPIEHVSFTFGVEGISRACSHQLVRHRIASFSQQSQRYVDMDNFTYVVPPDIADDDCCNKAFDSAMKETMESYKRLCASLSDRYTEQFVNEGMDSVSAAQAAQKRAQEDARFVLPNACETKIILTMNARSLINFFKLRCCNRAQWEIRAVAIEMLRLCCEVAPHLFSTAGPGCCRGKCPENNMTCGKSAEVKTYFNQLRKGK